MMISKRYIGLTFALAAALFLGLGLESGCAKKTNQPLPTGAINQTDAATYRVLADAHAFLQSIGDSVRAGKLTLNAQQKVLYNNLVASSNAADATWKAYHSGQSTDAATLTKQVNQLNSDLTAAQAAIGVK